MISPWPLCGHTVESCTSSMAPMKCISVLWPGQSFMSWPNKAYEIAVGADLSRPIRIKLRTKELMCSAVKSTERHGGWRSWVLRLTLIHHAPSGAHGSEPVCQSCMNSKTGMSCLMVPSHQVEGANDADEPHTQVMPKGQKPWIALFHHDPMPAFTSRIALHPPDVQALT